MGKANVLYTGTMEDDLAIRKRKQMLTFTVKWVEMDTFAVSELSQTEKRNPACFLSNTTA